MVISAISGQTLPAWTCLVLGVIMIVVGGVIGLIKYFENPSATKVQAAAAAAKAQVGLLSSQAVASANTDAVDPNAATTATTVESSAKSAIEDLANIISAFPNELRFPVFLILVGGLVMSVATVQFGGHSIF